MIKKRVTASLIVKNGVIVQSFNFNRYLPIGSLAIAVEHLNNWGIDEIIILDLDATPEKRGPNIQMIHSVSEKCFVPLVVGGGISTISDIRCLIHNGADKVVINKAAINDLGFVRHASTTFGNQCIVISIDVRKKDDQYEIFVDSGETATGLCPIEFARRLEDAGAGEILLNSIDRDGSKTGYDLKLISRVADAVRIPVIACGGVGHPKHIADGIHHTSASAFAVGNYFHFIEHSVVLCKAYLIRHGFDIRLDTRISYDDFEMDDDGRLTKMDDNRLENLRFQHYRQEIL